MATRKQRAEDAKKRDKRSKVALIALGVLLAAVAAYEVPSMLAVMNKKPPPGTTYDPGPSSVVPGSLPNVAITSTTAAATAKPSTGDLVNTDVPPESGAGQLVTFEVFQTKNPFVPQVSSAPTPPDTSGAPATGAAPTPTTTATTTTTTTGTTPASTPPPSAVPSSGATPATTTPVAASTPTVTISVNGVISKVGVTGTFPTGAPVFRLVSYQSGSAQIGIVGGSYAAGGAALTLEVGHPVTLQNTTNGTQYRLELLKTP